MKNKSKRIASILLIMSILAFPCLQVYAESVVSIYDLGNDVARGSVVSGVQADVLSDCDFCLKSSVTKQGVILSRMSTTTYYR